MPVTLQIVGLYYKQSLDIPFDQSDTITVKDVLDFAETQHPNGTTLKYGVGHGAGSQYIDYIMFDIPHQFSSPVSKTLYFPGSFKLAQTFTKLGVENYTVWQYYVRDQEGRPVPTEKGSQNPEVPFGMASIVKDNYTVIWRLVEICKALPVPTRALAAEQAPDATRATPHLATGGPVMNARFAKVVGMPASKA